GRGRSAWHESAGRAHARQGRVMRKGRESRDLAGVEPLLLVAVFAGSGPFLVLAPVPVALAALVLVACFSRAFSVGVLCLATGAAAVGTWRAYETIGDYQVARAEAASLLRPPARCALLGQVTDSPTVRDETTRFRLHVTQ